MTHEIISVTQGTPEWEAHRAQHYNASDAPAMLGVSPYKTRAQLVREHATGVTAEIDETTQRRFDDGHRFEALARPLAEKLIGEELFPCVGVLKGTKYSASFDGLTMLFDTAFEHKSLNDAIRNAIDDGIGNGVCLPEYLRVQMEQQCMVSGAERVLFMASKWDGETLVEERHCWYYPDAALREKIVNGWAQFDEDVTAYVPEQTTAPAPVATPVEGFGSLALRVEGRVLASNLDTFRASADAFLARLPKPAELETDQDFADADAAVKACTEAEGRIKAAKDAALAQMSDVDAVMRTADTIAETIRAARLALDKAVKSEKDRRKAEIVGAGVEAVRAHYATINATLGEHAISAPQSLSLDIGGAIKGLKTLSSIKDAVDTAVANAKIAASQRADAVRASVAALTEAMAGHETLFADRVTLCASKAPDDLRNLAAARIAEHKAREAQRLANEAERARLIMEAKQRESVAQSVEQLPSKQTVVGSTPTGLSNHIVDANKMVNARMKLGEINARIAPIKIDAEGLAQLGFNPVGTERAAKFYNERDFPKICEAIIAIVSRAVSQQGMAA